jgi:hypothetical protein
VTRDIYAAPRNDTCKGLSHSAPALLQTCITVLGEAFRVRLFPRGSDVNHLLYLLACAFQYHYTHHIHERWVLRDSVLTTHAAMYNKYYLC